jgi:hypothetical protein
LPQTAAARGHARGGVAGAMTAPARRVEILFTQDGRPTVVEYVWSHERGAWHERVRHEEFAPAQADFIRAYTSLVTKVHSV